MVILNYRDRIAENRFARAVFAVLGANVVAALLTINNFVHARIQGPWFYRFEVLFGIFLTLSFSWADKVLVERDSRKWWRPVIFGVVAGLSGALLALVFSPIVAGESSRFVHLIRMPGGMRGLILLPLVLMSWFVGAVAGLIWIIIPRSAQKNVVIKKI
jgi:hypothetical protein